VVEFGFFLNPLSARMRSWGEAESKELTAG
jgi:hypothetical protein